MSSARRPARTLVAGADIGGTFTDVCLLDPKTGRSAARKVLTTHRDPADAVLAGLADALAEAGLAADRVALVAHATTLATNALIERRGARTGMLTTRGFRDVIEVGYEQLYDLYDLHLDLPAPLVPRALRRPVAERTGADGERIEGLDAESADAAVRFLIDRRVESIAVCFLHAYANPENERAAADRVRALAPDLPVSTSSEVLPELGELPRFSTTVANAYVRPLVARYLVGLKERLRAAGHRGAFTVVSSRGGTMSPEAAARFPVRMLESGPAAGAHAAAAHARRLRLRNLLSFDMGGTSAKICLVRNHAPQVTVEFEAARVARFKPKSGLPIRVPVVDLIEIGAGGGSIARVDDLGLPAVGPRSAGSEPGPACYARGGREPTVTDADAVLGYLDPEFFLGGRLRLDTGAAKASLDERVGRPLGTASVEEAAWTVFRQVNEQMARAAAVHASEHGVDLRRFALLAFGGAGPIHAAPLARALGVRRVVVPPEPGVLSALGAVLAPPCFDLAVSYRAELERVDLDRVNRLLAELEAQGRALLDEVEGEGEGRVEAGTGGESGRAAKGGADGRGGGAGRRTVVRQVDMRYRNQRYEVPVPLPPSGDLARGGLPALEGAFHRAYERRYGRAIRGVPAEAVTWRVSVSAPPSATLRSPRRAAAPKPPPDGRPEGPAGRRPAWFGGGFTDTPFYRRARLPSGTRLEGPAIVEEDGSTTVLPPGARGAVDPAGNLVIDL